MARVFISYKRDVEPDQPLAYALFERLLQSHDPFIDQGMLVGERWAERIRREIEESDYMVLLLSERAIESQMVVEEVRIADAAQRRHGHPRLLPVRLAFQCALPYEIGAILNPVQYVAWSNPDDSARVVNNILSAVEGNVDKLIPAGDEWQAPLPPEVPISAANPTAYLEAPEGTIAMDSSFYVERSTDRIAMQEQNHHAFTLTIKGPRQMGKSSLLGRVIGKSHLNGDSVAFVDFQMFGRETLENPDKLFYQFCFLLEDSLGLQSELDSFWRVPLAPSLKCARFMERRLLPSCNSSRLLVAIDEADSLLISSARSDFFGMLRSWHNQRAHSPAWKQLSLAMVISTEPSMLIDSDTQSPFNVGALVELEDFNLRELRNVNVCHDSPLSDFQVDELFQLIGGHPYLSRKSLYGLCQGRYDFKRMLRDADSESGPFGDHLRAQLSRVQRRGDLIVELASALRIGHCSDNARLRLIAGGLLVEKDGKLAARNRLYERYFRRVLRGQ